MIPTPPRAPRQCNRPNHDGCDCVAPILPVKVLGETTPEPMDHHEKMRLRAAAFRATKLHPGPVGELVSRELLTWEEFGYRLGRGTNSLVMRLVDHVTNTPLPGFADAGTPTTGSAA